MASATLKIFALDKAQGGYPAELSEEGKATVTGLLPVAAFGSGQWTVNLDPQKPATAPDPADPDPPRDIVETVVGTPGKDRPSIDWPKLAATLCDLLFPAGPLRDAFAKFKNETRLFLDIDPPELARVPWELAQDRRVILPLTYSVSRLHVAGANNPPSPWPLRILVLIGCTAKEEVALGVDSEIAQIRRAFLPYGRSVDLHVCSRMDWDGLRKLIQGDGQHDRWEPHVLHFVGHTGLAPDNTVGLTIENGTVGGPVWIWSQQSIGVDLGLLNWAPQFVFLNACRTGDDPAGAWSMQRTFIEAGAQCVITMQADVNGAFAGLFASQFYRKIAAGCSIQDATLAGRLAVYGQQRGGGLIDWALPSLSSASRDLVLFTPRPAPSDPDFATCKEFSEARVFANCEDSRRLLTHWICPARVTQPRQTNVVVITGQSKSGKTHLIKWAMESWLVGEARVRYIELHDGTSRDFLSILRQIRDGDGKGGKRLLQRRLPTAAFKRFNWTLKNLLRSEPSGEWLDSDHPGEEVEDDLTLKLLPAVGEERLEPMICAEFHAALKIVAEEKPLVLVFDKFTENDQRLVSPEDFAQIVTHLFKPIAAETGGRVKLVFCANSVEREAYKLTEWPPSVLTYEVPIEEDVDKLVTYAGEMLRFPSHYTEARIAEMREQLEELARVLFKFKSDGRYIEPLGIARLSRVLRNVPEGWLADNERMQ